jgi:hypothetical protein
MTESTGTARSAPQGRRERFVADLGIIETILRNRYHYYLAIRDGVGLPAKMRAMLVSSAVFLALYGAVLGSTHSALQALSSAVKLPLLFLATAVITAPTLYFFNILYGSSQALRQNIALVLTTITVTSVILLAFTPISLFFLLTTSGYQFFKLLNVAFFAIAGAIGVGFLNEGMRIAGARGRVVVLWVVLYALVGSQMAWTLRPFIGAPSMRFEVFRQLGGNFYSDVLTSLGEMLGLLAVA